MSTEFTGSRQGPKASDRTCPILDHRNTQNGPDAADAQFDQFLRFNCPFTQFRITLIHVFNFETKEKNLMNREALH